jgi:hypothetical protein
MVAQKKYWAKKDLLAEALKYSTRKEFEVGSKSAHSVARARGKEFYESCCEHMVAQFRYWTDDSIRAEALKYSTRSEFSRGSKGACVAAGARGKAFYESCCQHMVDASRSDNDTVYIWKAEGAFYMGDAVYKIGVTSARLGMRRIKIVEKESNFKATVIALIKVSARANLIEKKLLALGRNPKYMGFDGVREFRAMNDAELQQALDILNQHAAQDELLAA